MWLEYSVAKDAAFCYACKNFGIRKGKSKEFVVKGYNNWKTAVGDNTKGLRQHNKCHTHLKAMERWGEFRKRQSIPGRK